MKKVEKLLNVPAFGMAVGTMWSLGLLVMTWLNALTGGIGKGWFSPCVRAFDYAFPGYYVGFWGGIWGAIVAFIFGLAVGSLFATIYNRFALPVAESPVVLEETPVEVSEIDEQL